MRFRRRRSFGRRRYGRRHIRRRRHAFGGRRMRIGYRM